jgi:hypothetical protein
LRFRRGFKTEANSLVTEIRSELGLDALECVDPWTLAAHLAISVINLSSLRHDAPGVAYLLDVEPEAFSAVTVFRGTERTVVYNDGHSPARQSSDVSHELAHGLLHHQPVPALDDRGCRRWDQSIEHEAEFLAGALLITEDAAIYIARTGMTESDAAKRFGVSPQMVVYRLNITGARVRVERSRARRTS